MKNFALVLSFFMVVGCSASRKAASTKNKSEDNNASVNAEMLTRIEEGHKLYEMHCGKCHDLKAPSSRTESQWKEIVPIMVGKANKKVDTIDETSQAKIMDYLLANCKKQ